MNVRNCKKCGKLFNYVAGAPVCPACKDALEEKFQEVKKYVQDNKGATIHDVSEECEVDAQQVRQWVREERLEFSSDGGVTGINCEKCGKAISTGRFCDKCKAELTNNLSSVLPKQQKENRTKKDPKDNPKMRFLQ